MATRQSIAPAADYRESILHKLSQQVTALQGSLEVALLYGQTSKDRKEAIEIALQQAARLAKLLEDLREDLDRVH